MALMPRRVKHRKSQRRRIKGNATRGHTVAFGDWGLQSLEPGHVKATAIEACRIAVTQYIRGEGRMYIRIFPHKSVTARPLETRMGKGKGEPDHWVAVVKPGTVLFEVAGISHEAARECFARVAHKLPVRVRLIGRRPTV
ncbi:MAG: 50S ribosomal protein L16 [Planctomycetaceae bacterium]|nr:50S ribosomal protein L16 [Planctomycetaceae bacterium]